MSGTKILMLAGMVCLAFGVATGHFLWKKHFDPKYEGVQRETFEHTKSYQEGKKQDLASPLPVETELIITVSEEAKIKDITAFAVSHGLKDVQVLESIKIITGRGPRDLINTLRNIEGVVSVEESQENFASK